MSRYAQLIDDARLGYQESGLRPICRAFVDNPENPKGCCLVSAALYHETQTPQRSGGDSTVTDWAANKYGFTRREVWSLVFGYDDAWSSERADYPDAYMAGLQFRGEMDPEDM